MIYKARCYLCPEPMYVAPGQLAYYHGHCRKKAREKYGSMSWIFSKRRDKAGNQIKIVGEKKVSLFSRIISWFKSKLYGISK